MPIFATAGAKLYIGTALAAKNSDFVEADFSAITWKEITPMETIGSLGDTASEITFEGIGNARTQKLKGTRNAGNMECVAGIDYADEGQIAVLAAEKTPYDYAFKLVFNDAPSGVGATPSERKFVAKVMSAAEALDAANNVMKMNFTLAINSNIVRLNADDGT
ncbi:MAG: hypothetical protein WBH00_11630 [Xanthobacteraceae bacterium]